jgi:hypothetical protein
MKTFDTPHFHMKVHDNGLVEFMVKKDILLSEADVWESQKLSLEALPGKKLFVLTEAEGEFSPTPDARRAGASDRYAQHVAAHALCSDNLTLKILGNLFISISKPKVRTRFFEDRNEALTWLTQQMEKSA